MGEVRESEWRGGPLPQEGGELGEEVGDPRLIGSIFSLTIPALSEKELIIMMVLYLSSASG